MKSLKSVGLGMMLAVALLAGCGEDTPENKPPDNTEPTETERCSSPAEYLAFDPANHAPQDLRLQRFDEMLKLFDEAKADPTQAAAKAQAALAIYTAADANLQVKVKGRQDFHFTPASAVGGDLDTHITQAIDALSKAADAHQVSLARQRFEKHGFFRFFYLSVHEELVKEPSYKRYDEAFGYLGTGATNAEAGRRGLARLATKRDAANGTTMAAELFDLTKEGACVIETALKSRNAISMGAEDDAIYVQTARRLDAKLQLVFVYSLGHELISFNPSDAQGAHIKLVEADGFFQTLEPYMQQAGGAKASLAQELRTAINEALSKVDNDPSWTQGFPAASLLQKLEEAFFVDVKA